MQDKKLTLFKIESEDGTAEYQVSEFNIPDAEPLASYNDIGELYPQFYNTSNNTYDVSNFTSNSLVQSYYATTPTRCVSEAAKASIGAASSLRNSGEGNPSYGTRWIHSLEEKRSKKIRVTDKIPKGWLEGRKIKFDKD